MVMILVIGIFIAVEPRLYQRGVAWMLPLESRDRFYRTAERMGFVMRRLMFGRLIGMAVEGVGTWLLLLIGGVPMAALLGILTGLLAFLPNIGAIISGVLIVLAGFSVSVDAGLWAIGVYFIVQTVDGYLIVPYVAKKTVDMAPALGARRAAPVRRPVRADGPRARRSDRGDAQDRARAEIRGRRGGSRGRDAAARRRRRESLAAARPVRGRRRRRPPAAWRRDAPPSGALP